MKLTLAAVALVAATGMAFAQGTVTQGGPTQGTAPSGPAANTPSATSTQPGVVPGSGPNATTATPGVASPAANASAASQTPPVPGRNSFTQAQAARRIRNAGFTHVSGLKKDTQGIWRGQAQKNGNATAVSLDYQGHVTAAQ